MAYAHALDALGDPTRRRIFDLLRHKPRSVGDVARHVPVSRPAVSQHLRVLKDAGLVADRADGAKRVYAIVPGGVAEVRKYFDELWEQALAAFKEAADEQTPPARRKPPRRGE
jgi:DNA-binding transcriptional ArsR family regulator